MVGNKGAVSKNNPEVKKQDYYEGGQLARLVKLLQKEIETTKALEKNSLPEKFWYKQQFAIGVNEVTRTLERMSPATETGTSPQKPRVMGINRRVSPVRLQAILIANDNPKWLTKHLPTLASSRKVPVIFVKDKRRGSLRLGELVKLKTAVAIGVKDKGNAINRIVEEVLRGNEIVEMGKDEQQMDLNAE
ncbi:hypothetical protein Tsubulata_006498 [Turnera subulata]|uniref:Ribosomal protein eL8/eL30/eS12/Gadd45 domain-containing protein n=1 Tax=Turnera subulata TaxID=218843 RepID=A0A9Q0F7I8_9ROSI|nr:hypothetical protein Tsubulata_006498 [Turnera subulata]